MNKSLKNKRQLFEAIAALTRSGWHDIGGYGGTGGPGVYLEHRLGFDAGSADRPDVLGWELKWHTNRTHLVTLFHKSPDNSPEIIRYLVRKYGRKTIRTG